jgi:hypothetical protein
MPAFLLALPLLKYAAIIGAVAALFGGTLYVGYQWGAKALPEAVVKQQQQAIEIKEKRNEVSEQSVVQYVDRIVKVREEAKVIIQEVPKYVPNDCTLPDSVRVFHDAAASGHFPDAQPVADANPAAPQDTPR